MPERALSFGTVADAYERYRPGYPAKLFDLVAQYAGRPVRSALEVDAGTGKATRPSRRPSGRRAPFLESDELLAPDGTPPGQELRWPGTELQRCELFTDVRQAVIERSLTRSAEEYVGLLSTVSAYLVLPEDARNEVFRRILAVLPERVELDADITAHLARRR
ncbi:hypothetical protein ACIG5E_20055 [Kitasatospora sp. NPDC053057]|uniref:hypothetical protein n=1 Tax=Kitasatospora sp. NPDC053057 TaxID=3364062 RepID=UPI0037CA42E1